MSAPKRDLADLYGVVREAQDAQREALNATDIARQAVFRHAREPLHPPQSPRWHPLGGPRRAALWAACFALVVLLGIVVGRPWLRPLSFAVDGTAGREGAWLAAGDSDEKALQFSDGTTLLLAPGSRARVREIDSDGAQVEIERGTGSLSVVHTSSARWSVQAGPYEVRVTGTRFDVSWDPATTRFGLVVHDGSVELRAPGAEARRVVAGQRLELADAASQPPTSPAGAPSADPLSPLAPQPVPPESSAGSAALAHPPSSSPAAKAQDYRTLARQGRYEDALAAANVLGFEGLVASSSRADVMLLGDIARYGGRADLARTAYGTLRSHHSGSDEAAGAAFTLGLMSFPSAGSIRHFETYLQERPGGALAGEALGRILLANKQSGNRAAARSAAARYLASYPAGPHAEAARSLLEP